MPDSPGHRFRQACHRRYGFANKGDFLALCLVHVHFRNRAFRTERPEPASIQAINSHALPEITHRRGSRGESKVAVDTQSVGDADQVLMLVDRRALEATFTSGPREASTLDT